MAHGREVARHLQQAPSQTLLDARLSLQEVGNEEVDFKGQIS